MMMRLSSKRIPERFGSAALLALSFSASPVLAQDRLTVDASASAGVSTNPFLGTGDTPAVATGTLEIRPSWVLETPLTEFRIDGDAAVTTYSKEYGTNENITVRGSGTHRISTHTSLNASVSYVNTVVGSFYDVGIPQFATADAATTGSDAGASTAPVVAAVPSAQPGLPGYITDPTLSGVGRRRQAYLASGGLSTMFSAHDQFGFDVSASANRSGGAGLEDFNYVSPVVSYSRVFSDKFSVGASFAVSISDYLGTQAGDATIYQPSFTATRSISERWTLTGSVGVALVDTRDVFGAQHSSASFNGSANVCRRDTRWVACFSASQQTLPSSFQGVRTQTGASASFNYEVNSLDQLSVVARYSHAGDPIELTRLDGAASGSLDYESASGSYQHRFGRALSGFATVGYSKSFGDGLRRDADFMGLVGVTYRFGGQS